MAAPKKIKGVKKPGPSPYQTTMYVAVARDDRGKTFGYPYPSGSDRSLGPHTGKPAGGYITHPPLAPSAIKTLSEYHGSRSRAATGQVVSLTPPRTMRNIKKK